MSHDVKACQGQVERKDRWQLSEMHLCPGHRRRCCCESRFAAVKPLLHKDQVNPIPDLANIPAGQMQPSSTPYNPWGAMDSITFYLEVHSSTRRPELYMAEVTHLSIGLGASLGFHLARYVARATCATGE